MGDGRVLAIVDTQEGSKLQEKLGAHWSISMDPGHKSYFGFRWLRLLRSVGDLQSPDGSELHTLAQTRRSAQRNNNLQPRKAQSGVIFTVNCREKRKKAKIFVLSIQNDYGTIEQHEQTNMEAVQLANVVICAAICT